MTAPIELLHKLQIKAGSKLWLINVPQAMAEELAAGAEVEIVREKDEYDGVIAFFDSAAEAEMLAPRILSELPPDGLLWVGGEQGNDTFAAAGWRGSESVALAEEGELRRFERG